MFPTKVKGVTKLLGLALIALSLLMCTQVYAADASPAGDTNTSTSASTQQQTPPPAAPTTSQAADNSIPTAAEMIENISKQLPSLMRLVTAIAYVLGMVFVLMGVARLKHMGESRTMMSQEHSLKGPLIYILTGAALIYLPNTVQVGMSTFWAVPNPYGYVTDKDQWSQLINTCLMVVQFFGVVAFIRGLVMLAQLGGGHGGHQGGLGKALTHMIGGIFCINIYQFVHVIMVTLGIQSVV